MFRVHHINYHSKSFLGITKITVQTIYLCQIQQIFSLFDVYIFLQPHTTANSEIVKESLVSHKPELPCSQDLTTINLDDLSSLHEEEPPDMCSPVLPEATTTPVGEELISTCIMPSRTKMGQKALLEEN